MNRNQLSELLDLLRSKGVIHFKEGVLEVTFGSLPEEELSGVDKPVNSSKVGKDGLTAEQQLEHYGRVLDAEE